MRLVVVAVTAAFFCHAAAAAEETVPPPPNILWLTCEDISPNLGCYGDDYACTPRLDRLAEEGVLYTNAYGITGVCAVNRSCLITGMYSSSIGSQGMRSTTRLPEEIECYSTILRRNGYYCTNNVKTDYNFPVPKGAWDENSRKAHWRNREAGQPFFAVFNYTGTHESRIRFPDARFFSLTGRVTSEQRHDPADVPLPPFHPDTPEVRQDWARYHDLITAMDYWVADMLAELEEAGLADETIVLFYSDHGAGMPGCKKWVWEGGLRVPLIIRVPEKYRKWVGQGAPGTRTDRLVSFVDFAPTVLSLTGVKVPGIMQGKAFLGPQAAAPREAVYGIRDRMAERFDTVRLVRNKRFQYLRNFQPWLTWSQYVSYTEQMPTMQVWRRLAEQGKLDPAQARYFRSTKPVEELYDVENDPHQVHNLAGDPKHADLLRRMRTQCTDWMKRTGDLGLLPEYEMLRRAEGRTPYAVGQDPEANPLPELLEAAALAGEMDPANIGALTELLKRDEPAVRWWGAMGLMALEQKAEPAEAALLEAADDPAPNVRVAAGEALCHVGRCEQGLAVLEAALEHDSAFIRLRAMNALDRRGAKAAPVLSAIEQADMKGRHVASYLGRMVGYLPEMIRERVAKQGPEK
jgi:uncharacterized sulfatase